MTDKTIKPKGPDKTVAGILGQITWLSTQSPRHKGLFIYDLEWLVMPAILLKQFKFFIRMNCPQAVSYGASSLMRSRRAWGSLIFGCAQKSGSQAHM